MTNILAKQDGATAPSSLTINVAELLSLLAIGGRLTLLVDPASSTNLASIVALSAPAADGAVSSAGADDAVAAPTSELLPPPAADSAVPSGDEEVAIAAAKTVPDPIPKASDSIPEATESIPEATEPSAPSLTFAQEAALDDDDAEAQVGDLEPPRRVVVISDSEDEYDDPNTRWYYVTRGREIGVFAGWHRVAPLVVCVPGSCFARTKTRAEAVKIFAKAFNSGNAGEIPY
ncbi:hypothetical protein FPV67DRAFT_1448606 [Lyophyllum atratum]|nr:hypothetical protein FPV67DRAFT_1448606 [Lyophyllum atratum]